MDKQHERDLLEIRQTLQSRIGYLDSSGFDNAEIAHRKEECAILIKKVNKIRNNRKMPVESIETVRGTSFKIGDKFHIVGDLVSVYTIVFFPDSVTVRGEASNPVIGKPWTCEIYIESIVKHKKEKIKNVKKEKKRKPVKIEVGEYFGITANNAIFKAVKVKKGIVVGKNELDGKKLPNKIKINTTEIILKTKKEYKKQRKAK